MSFGIFESKKKSFDEKKLEKDVEIKQSPKTAILTARNTAKYVINSFVGDLSDDRKKERASKYAYTLYNQLKEIIKNYPNVEISQFNEFNELIVNLNIIEYSLNPEFFTQQAGFMSVITDFKHRYESKEKPPTPFLDKDLSENKQIQNIATVRKDAQKNITDSIQEKNFNKILKTLDDLSLIINEYAQSDTDILLQHSLVSKCIAAKSLLVNNLEQLNIKQSYSRVMSLKAKPIISNIDKIKDRPRVIDEIYKILKDFNPETKSNLVEINKYNSNTRAA